MIAKYSRNTEIWQGMFYLEKDKLPKLPLLILPTPFKDIRS